jgi:hypothetical protein
MGIFNFFYSNLICKAIEIAAPLRREDTPIPVTRNRGVDEPVDKPGSVVDGHSSATHVTVCL